MFGSFLCIFFFCSYTEFCVPNCLWRIYWTFRKDGKSKRLAKRIKDKENDRKSQYENIIVKSISNIKTQGRDKQWIDGHNYTNKSRLCLRFVWEWVKRFAITLNENADGIRHSQIVCAALKSKRKQPEITIKTFQAKIRGTKYKTQIQLLHFEDNTK